MGILGTFDWNGLSARWEAWHNGKLGSPAFMIDVAPPPGSVKVPRHFLSAYDFSVPAGQILDEVEAYLDECVYIGDSYPSRWLNFGPGVLAAMVGGEGHSCGERTVWFSPGKWEGCEASEISVKLDRDSVWFRRIDEFLHAADKRGGRIHIGCTDIGGTLDVVSSLRPGEKLLLDLYDCPEEIKRLIREVHETWFEAYGYFCSAISNNHGYSAWDGIFSLSPYYMLQCDFCYMISPEMFGEFVLPELAECCRKLSRSFYHLDGAGELPHLPQILSIEELDGIQWIPGAGAKPFTEWTDIYRMIADAGKKIWVSPEGNFDGVSRLIDEIGKPELFVIRDGVPYERADELAAFISRYRP